MPKCPSCRYSWREMEDETPTECPKCGYTGREPEPEEEEEAEDPDKEARWEAGWVEIDLDEDTDP